MRSATQCAIQTTGTQTQAAEPPPNVLATSDTNIGILILDIDLDYFRCQEPAMVFMQHHGWTTDLTSRFNGILQHHQYNPGHMPSDQRLESLFTLIHLLSNDDPDFNLELRSRSRYGRSRSDAKSKTPSVANVLDATIDEKMGTLSP